MLRRRPKVLRCRRKFLRCFKRAFHDETYFDWERGYKERAHLQWLDKSPEARFRALLEAAKYASIAAEAVRIEAPLISASPQMRTKNQASSARNLRVQPHEFGRAT